MIIAVSVGGRRIGRIHVRKPITGGNFAGSIEYQPAQRIALVGIGVDSPVLLIKIFGNRLVHADHNLFVVSSFASFFSVDNIGFGSRGVAFFYQNFLHEVLHSFHVGNVVGVFFLNFFDDKSSKELGGL